MGTAFGVGVSVLLVRGLLRLGREPGEASEVAPGGRGWMLYLVLLFPVAVAVMWGSVRINSGIDVALFVGYFAFSGGGGLVLGYVRWSSDRESFSVALAGTYAAAVVAALCLAASQTPLLPIVEIEADRNEARSCPEVPADDVYVMLDRADSYLYVYNDGGLLSLPDDSAETLRFRECREYLDRD